MYIKNISISLLLSLIVTSAILALFTASNIDEVEVVSPYVDEIELMMGDWDNLSEKERLRLHDLIARNNQLFEEEIEKAKTGLISQVKGMWKAKVKTAFFLILFLWCAFYLVLKIKDSRITN
jgi:predicted PurR-regulated permease PerM